jgi:ribosome-associated protein
METRTFQLRDEFIELHHLLKFEGVASSGGAAKALVASGAVFVDGAVELRKSCKIRAGQQVRTADVQIDVRAANRSA